MSKFKAEILSKESNCWYGEAFPEDIEAENEEAYRWNWDAPLLISQFDNKRLYFGANKKY